jgi:diguanylate cyclase (GGDEF)-like protein
MMDAMLLAHESSNENIARVIVLTGVSAALIVGLIVAQNRVRTAAAKNHSHSVTDPLTGLSNLRGLRARLRQELHRSARDESEIVMFAIDLDDFKEVNDRFSYALGDAVLQAVAHALENEIEPGDLLARRGGDEFAILTVATPGRHMARFGDRIAASIERTRRAICPGVNPRASVTRVNHRHGESAEHFLRRVDDGLHDAKLDAHPERIGHEPGGTGDHPEVGADEQRSPLLEGARRVQLGLRHPARPERARSATTLEWRMTAATAFVPAALIAIIVGFGLVPDAERPSTLFCVLGLLVCAGLSFAAAGSTVDRRWLHVSVAVTTTLTIACVALSGDASYPMAELCILPAPLAVMLFGWKRAMPYAIVSAGAFAYIVIDAGGQFAILQSALTIGVIAVLVVLLQRGERLTTQFTAAAEAISIVDPLTGAANLRGFVSRVEQEIARCDALGEELSLVMIDLDRFKAVNDRYSHSMGDALLIETTRAIESVVREDEMVVRRGGDEFVVICAAGVPRELDALTGRLADAIFTARIRLTPDIAAGATVINVYRRHAEDAESFMRRADEELRLAKARERAGSPRS